MVKRRVIPTLLCRGRTLVKGERFNSWRTVGVVAQAVRIHQARQVDEVCLLDIAATAESRGPDLGLISELSESLFSPLAVGGGIRSVEDAEELLRSGADKLVVCSSGPKIIEDIAHRFGSQAVAAAIDAKWEQFDGGWFAKTHCGSKCTSAPAVDWARVCTDAGAGEILLTAIDREGTLLGYDLDLIRQVRAAVKVPLVAHGGAGIYEHMLHAIQAGADAVAAGAMFQFTDQTPRGAAEYLVKHGIDARLA
jgi:cyclase